jgi:hypothetical protein
MSSPELERLLDWLGYLTIYRGADEEPLVVQFTDQGRRHFRRKQTPRADLRPNHPKGAGKGWVFLE